MPMARVTIVGVFFSLFLAACAPNSDVASSCNAPNGMIINHSGGCTVYRSFATTKNLLPQQVSSLIIFMHGDMSRGHSDYMYRIAELYRDRISAAGGTNAEVMGSLRKGYGDGKGGRSSGKFLRTDEYQEDVVSHFQGFLQEINKLYPNAKITLVGHSGGAAIASIIAGRNPELAESFVLIGTPGDIDRWRRDYRSKPWPLSLNPVDYIAGTEVSDSFVVVSSDGDAVAPLPLSVDYVERLKSVGRNVELINLGPARHNALVRNSRTIRKTWEVAQ